MLVCELQYMILECSLKNSVFKTFCRALFGFFEKQNLTLTPSCVFDFCS